MAIKPKELKNFNVKEVSFVKKGANRKRRYMVKSEETALEKLIEIIKNSDVDSSDKYDSILKEFLEKALPTPPPEVDQPIATETEIEVEDVTGIPDEAMVGMKNCLVMLDMIREFFPQGTYISIGSDGLSIGIYKSEEPTDSYDSIEKAIADLNEIHIKEIEELKVQISKEFGDKADKAQNLEEFKSIIKGEQPVDTVPISKEIQEKIEKQEEEIRVLKEDLAKKEDIELSSQFLTKAEKEFNRLGKAEDVADVLKKISKSVGTTEFGKLTDILKFAQGQLETSADITKELGTAQTTADDPVQKIQKMAEEIQAKTPSLTIEQARVQVYKSHPELIEQ
jgi:hypothetical protein